jgi:hypothetical protein
MEVLQGYKKDSREEIIWRNNGKGISEFKKCKKLKSTLLGWIQRHITIKVQRSKQRSKARRVTDCFSPHCFSLDVLMGPAQYGCYREKGDSGLH